MVTMELDHDYNKLQSIPLRYPAAENPTENWFPIKTEILRLDFMVDKLHVYDTLKYWCTT